jgi:hypothetical protein
MKMLGLYSLRAISVVLYLGFSGFCLFAETIYIDSRGGSDSNPGTEEKPLQTIAKAAELVNNSKEAGPTTIKIRSGTYNLDKCVEFKNDRAYTEKNRLTIEAEILPDDPNWKPALMPVVLSTENSQVSDMMPEITETYGIKIKISHVTIRGLRFFGNPSLNNWHNCIERIGENLDDLLITQCMFAGDPDTLDIYSAVLATGDGFKVDYCVFENCHASTVYWDGIEGIGGKKNAMRYCIVDGGFISGVWTCQTSDDFEFHHNIVTDTEYFWMRKKTNNPIEYTIKDCIIDVNKFSGYGVASGPIGQTGEEVTYREDNVLKSSDVMLVKDKRARNYLHPVDGSIGSDLGAGLFKKKQ